MKATAVQCLLVFATMGLLVGCNSAHRSAAAGLEITAVPSASIGGPTRLEAISGRVRHPVDGAEVVLYARSGIWWIQPLTDQPFTRVKPDGTWENVTHLGSEYAALLVEGGYQPAAKLTMLPHAEGNVLAVASVQGKKLDKSLSSAQIEFSGFQWSVQSGVSDHGGRPYVYDTANAWTDPDGKLHLKMGSRNGHWSCAEISLNKKSGYGTYTFVVEDSSHLRPSAVLGMFTWDDGRSTNFRNEMDIELSRWGNVRNKNAQFVVQPFYSEHNLVRFVTSPGTVTYTLEWLPGKAIFTASHRDSRTAKPSLIEQHVFTADVPTPADERIHVDLYDFQHVDDANNAEEAVIDRFSFQPL